MLRRAVRRLQRNPAIGERTSHLNDDAVIARQHALKRCKRAINNTEVNDFATRLNSSGVVSLTGENTDAIALFSQTSIGPKRFSVVAAAASIPCASATSHGSTTALPPSAVTSRAASSRASRQRAITPMRAPSLAKPCAAARRTPAEAPVITMTLGRVESAIYTAIRGRTGSRTLDGQRKLLSGASRASAGV